MSTRCIQNFAMLGSLSIYSPRPNFKRIATAFLIFCAILPDTFTAKVRFHELTHIGKDVGIHYCDSIPTAYFGEDSRFLMSFAGHRYKDLSCVSMNNASIEGQKCNDQPTSPIGSDTVKPTSTTPSNSDYVVYIRIYKCPKGFHWISYNLIQITQCINGKWSQIFDYCEADCGFPRVCSDLQKFDLIGGTYHFLFPTAKLHDYPQLIFCTPDNFMLVASNLENGTIDNIRHNTIHHDRTFIGLMNLKLLTRELNGDANVFELEVVLSHANETRRTVYNEFKIDADSTILSLGQYHGDAGSFMSIGSKIASADRFWGPGGRFRMFETTKWGKDQIGWEIRMYIRLKELTPDDWCRLNVNMDSSWNTLLKWTFPHSREIGAQIKYECLGELVTDAAGQKFGSLQCTDDSHYQYPQWIGDQNLPCKIDCPSDFVESENGKYCIHFSTTTVKDIYWASVNCIEKNSSLLLTTDKIDLTHATTDVSYFTSIQNGFANVSEQISKYNYNKMNPLYDMKDDEEACAVIKSPKNIIFAENCSADHNYICRLPPTCEGGYEASRDGGCYKLHIIDNTTMFRAMHACSLSYGGLPYPATEQLLHSLLSVARVHMKRMGWNYWRIPLALNKRLGDWSFNGSYNISAFIQNQLGSPPKDNMYLYLNKSTYEFKSTAIWSTYNAFICHFHSYGDCLFDDPGDLENAYKIKNFTAYSPVGSTATYICHHRYFVEGEAPKVNQRVTCIGSLGGYNRDVKPCVFVEICKESDEPISSIESEFSIYRDNETYYLDGEITYDCPAAMTTAGGLTTQTFICSVIGSTVSFRLKGDFTIATLQECDACSYDVITSQIHIDISEIDSPILIGQSLYIECPSRQHISLGNNLQEIPCNQTGFDYIYKECYDACSGEPKTANSTRNISRSRFESDNIGSSLMYECFSGHYLKPFQETNDFINITNVTCTAGGWVYENEAQPLECVLITKDDPRTPGEGMILDWDGYTRTIGSKAEYSCLNGGVILPYMKTNITINATENGWHPELSQNPFECSTACQQTLPVAGKNVTSPVLSEDPHDKVFGSKLKYTCDSGLFFIPILGQAIINETEVTCKINGEWELDNPNQLLECIEVILEDPLLPPAGMNYDWDNFTRKLDEKVTYTCNDTEELIMLNLNSTFEITATPNGWSPSIDTDLFYCNYVCTKDPPEAFTVANIISDFIPVEKHNQIVGTRVNYTCENGTYLIPTEEHPKPAERTYVTCEKGEGWVKERSNQLVCVYLTLDDPAVAPNNSWYDWDNISRIVGVSVTYVCNDTNQVFLYNLNNSITVKATMDGWKPTLKANEFKCDTSCLEDPPALGQNMKNLAKIFNSFSRENGAQLRYRCTNNTFFKPTEESPELIRETFITCREGTWIKEFPDKALKCFRICNEDIPTPNFYSRHNWNNYSRDIDTEIVFQCPDNHLFVGNSKSNWTINCTESGWTNVNQEFFTCGVACLEELPNNISNAQLNASIGFTFSGYKVSYECNPMYATVEGARSLNQMCLNGTWGVPYTEISFYGENATVNEINDTAKFLCEKACATPPPIPTEGSDFNFTGDYREETVVHYSCNRTFFRGYLTEFNSTCYNGSWTMPVIPECVNVTVNVTKLNPASDAEFYTETAFYVEDHIYNFNTTTGEPLEKTKSVIPLGDGAVFHRDKQECAFAEEFYPNNEVCANDPIMCEDGFSFSIWALILSEKNESDKRYLMSTGGDRDGSPGISMYQEGDNLRAVVSTGENFWEVRAYFHTPEGQWTVISCRWSADIGLDMYMLNRENGLMQRLAKTHYPTASVRKVGLDPPMLLFGCHATGTDKTPRNFLSGSLDGFVVWREIVDDMKWFPGGFRVETMNLEDIFKLLPLITKTAENIDSIISQVLIAQEKAAIQYEVYSTSTQNIISTGTENETPMDTDGHISTIKILSEIIKMEHCPKKTLGTSDIDTYHKALKSFNNLLPISDENKKTWNQLREVGPENEIMHLVVSTVDFLECVLHRVTEEDNKSVEKIFNTENVFVVSTKNKLKNLQGNGLIVIPSMNIKLGDTWNTLARVAVDPYMADDSRCENRSLSITVEEFNSVSFLHILKVNEVDLNPNDRLEIDSVILAVRIRVDPIYFDDGKIDTSQPGCNFGKQSGFPVDMKLRHETVSRVMSTRRQFFFFKEDTSTEIIKRYCAKYDTSLYQAGAWDISNCLMHSSTDEETRCLCKSDGVFAIIAQKRDLIEVSDDPEWLLRTKYILYGISAFLLCIYILVVLISGDLKDQFHLIGLNLCLAVLFGSIAMVASDFSSIREDQEICGAISSVIFYFYLSVGTWTVSLGHSSFRAITAGIISGKLQSYMFMSWGFSLTGLGLIYMFFLHEIGTDPRCFVAYENDAKTVLLGPQLFFAVVAIFLSLVILCNLSTPALRKDNLIDDYGSFCRGAAIVLFTFGLTWIFAIFAYMRLGIEKPDFYPIFTVLNSSMGIIIFLFIGIGSNRFRTAITGKANRRKQQMKRAAFGLPAFKKRGNDTLVQKQQSN